MSPNHSFDHADENRQQMVAWFLRRQHLSDWTPKDEQAFQQWLSEAGNRQAYTQWEADWQLIDDLPQDAIARLRAQVALDRALAQADSSAQVHEPEPARRHFLKTTLGATTMAGVAMGAGVLGWQLWSMQPQFQQIIETKRGEQRQEHLPDGSLLALDTSTTVHAAYYRNRRELILQEGQAAFSVRADAGKPFHVVAGDVRITVTGTRFSVRNTPDQQGRDAVEVVVEEGSVRVEQGQRNANGEWRSRRDTSAYALKAGQQIAFTHAEAKPVVTHSATADFASWREQRISFSNTPLQQAIAELERYADTGITHIDPRVAQLRLSGTFNPSDATTTRQLLEGALPIRLQPEGQGYRAIPR